MASVNKVIIVGYLGADPEVRKLSQANGDSVANISVATTKSWKNDRGEEMSRTEWHRIVFYSPLAKVVADYLKKGSPVYVEGELRTNKWTDQQGIERWRTEIVAHSMQMLGSRKTEQNDEWGGM